MKKYLEDFFVKFNYCEEDAKVLLDTYDKISANPEADGIWKEAMSLYDENIDCDYKQIIRLADKVALLLCLQEYTVELLIFICLSRKAKEVYEQRGISEQIYYDNMMDLRYKMDECKLVKGIVGTFVPMWFSGFFALTKFTLGRLQFEMAKFGENYECERGVLNPESDVINVHIPRSLKPLDEESCEEAYQQAKEFFADKIGDACAFICHSWLLWPQNKEILSKTSNTYRFISRFDIIKSSVDKDRLNLWRLFDTDEKNIERLPADTSMRRAYIEHLKKGGKLGIGMGVFIL